MSNCQPNQPAASSCCDTPPKACCGAKRPDTAASCFGDQEDMAKMMAGFEPARLYLQEELGMEIEGAIVA